MRIKKIGKKKNKRNYYDEISESFEKLNESLEVLNSVSKSLRLTAKVLKGPIKTNLSTSTENMKVTAKIIDDIKSRQIELDGPKYSVFDAKDLDII